MITNALESQYTPTINKAAHAMRVQRSISGVRIH